jgi:hypothetical protein
LSSPDGYRVSGLFRDLELNWPMRLLLHDDGSCCDLIAMADVEDAQLEQVTCAKL